MTSDDAARARYELPGIGALVDDGDGEWATPPLHTPAVGGDVVYTVFDAEEFEDELPAIAEAISNFRKLPAGFFRTHATRATYTYYKDTFDDLKDQPEVMEWMPVVEEPEDVFNHVTFGRYANIYKGYPSKDHFFVGLGCSCEWEEEHGLTYQLRDGKTLTYVGQFDDSGEWPENTYDASGDGLYRTYWPRS